LQTQRSGGGSYSNHVGPADDNVKEWMPKLKTAIDEFKKKNKDD
jgi:hypothetical protein